MSFCEVLIRNRVIGIRVFWRKAWGCNRVILENRIGSGSSSKSFFVDANVGYHVLRIHKWLLQLVNYLVALIEASLSDVWIPRKSWFAIQWLLDFRCWIEWSFRNFIFKRSFSAGAATKWRTFDFGIFSEWWLELIWTCWSIRWRLHKTALIMNDITISTCSILFVMSKIPRFRWIWNLLSFWTKWI